MKIQQARFVAASATFAALLFGASVASAQTATPTVTCASLTNPVYLTGSTALRGFVGIVGKLLASDAAPTTVVYQAQGSCFGPRTIYEADPSKRVIKDAPSVGGRAANYAIFFKADGSAQECFLEPDGTPVTIGISDVYAKTCGYNATTDGSTVTDYFGPVQPMTFVVPATSRQQSISAEAAYLAFGTGNGGPWSDPRFFFIRNATSGTQQMVANLIGVPGNAWWGVDRGGSSGVRDQLKIIVDQAQADKSIGILSSDVADAERANLRVLAYQAKEQLCGYLPDSSATSRDKANVRDGHYDLWGPSHLFARTVNGAPSAAALAFLSRFVTPRVPIELLDAEIAGALVPQCAMNVTRTEEAGPMQSYQPPYSCGCYFDAKTKGSSDCKVCESSAECPSSAPTCNFGYCEVQ
jgi:ABC-type phosphate transport system substrate-binding protein